MRFVTRFPPLALSLLAFFFFFCCAPAFAQTQGIVTLSELRSVARPLLIFAPKPDDPQLGIQLRTINQHLEQAHACDLVPIAIPYQSPSSTAARLTVAGNQAARRRFRVAPANFTVVLLNKQGHETLRSTKPLSILKLCAGITGPASPRSH